MSLLERLRSVRRPREATVPPDGGAPPRVAQLRALFTVLLVTALLGTYLVTQASGQAFQQDDRIIPLEPATSELSTFPVELRWAVREDIADQVERRELFFAVFVDRPPVRRGQTLAALADDECLRQEGCPDRQWLAERRVFVALDSELTIPVLGGSGLEGRAGRVTVHEATIVVMNAAGQRVDEHATVMRFRTEGGS